MIATTAHAWWQDLEATDFRWHVPETFNIAEACTDLQTPGNTALIVDSSDALTTYSFGQLGVLSRKFMGLLQNWGLNHGDRVAIMVPQGVEVLTAHLGSFRGGFVTVPMSVKFGATAVAYRLRDSGAKALVIDADCYDRIKDALADTPDLTHVVVVGRRVTRDPSIDAHILDYRAEVENQAESAAPAVTGPRSPAIIIYTSGTTGSPKGALHGHQILLAHMPGVRTSFGNAPQPQDVFWTPADWAWIGGLFDVLFTVLSLGCPVVATPDKFDPQRTLDLLRRHRITCAFIPPTALKQMRSSGIDADAAAGTTIRTLATGGEALGEVIERWVETTFRAPINEFYGQTEMNLTVGTSRTSRTTPPGCMGRAFPGFELALLDPSGHAVPDGRAGEICIRTGNPGQMLRYWNDPDKTAKKIYAKWIHTGDLAKADTNGDLWYEGRADDVISTAGYRVGPSEIEDCLLSHPAVSMAAVIGIPDELRGESVKAFVVLSRGYVPSKTLSTDLQNHVKLKLAFYQYPRSITYLEELPMTATGKIMRKELRNHTGPSLRADLAPDPTVYKS
ncbi:AMP-binding protein [Cryobacterium sp. Y57]|uniref:AMP-binding protein n=1 Tax=Cryobacterium sp. Y57 TaxID=2048287 RepID=UPI0018EBBA54|nr:AMP-binding protein [Cryobacterium sp. Y57]